MSLADAVLFVVDATVGITDADEAVVRILRKSGKPVVLAANKVDVHPAPRRRRTACGTSGSASRTRSRPARTRLGDMLDAILAALPGDPAETFEEVGGPRRIAIVGKPNVGKSSSAQHARQGGPRRRRRLRLRQRPSTRSTS